MSDTLKHDTAKGFLWGMLNNSATQLLNLLFGIVLARLLTPDDYGVVGVLTVFSVVAVNLQTCGFIQGLCNLKNPTHSDYNSVFWFNITMSTVIYAVLFVLAPLIAAFFREPRLVALSRFVFLGFWITSFSIVPNAYMFKNLMVRQTAVVGIMALLVSGCVGIGMAFMGYSYWALAWQQIVYMVVVTVVRYVYVPFRPSFTFTLQPIRNMFGFSVKMMFTWIVNALSQNVLTFLFGRFYPMHVVGNYSQANKWGYMATWMLQGTISQVAQPVLARVSGDAERSLRVLRKMVRFTACMSFPVMFGLALVATEFIQTALGDKWLTASLLLRIIALGSSVLPLTALLQNVAITHGRSGIFMTLNIAQIIVQVVIVLLLSHMPMHIIVSAIMTFMTFCLFVWWATVSGMAGGYRLALFLYDMLPFALMAAFAMTCTCYATCGIQSAPLLLLARVVMGAATYLAQLYIFKRDMINELIAYVRSKT